jgi:hypothetical protein
VEHEKTRKQKMNNVIGVGAVIGAGLFSLIVPFKFIWVAVLLWAVGFSLDLASTIQFLRRGYEEGNPILHFLLKKFGMKYAFFIQAGAVEVPLLMIAWYAIAPPAGFMMSGVAHLLAGIENTTAPKN